MSSGHAHGLDRELAAAHVEEVLEAGPEEIDDEDVVQALLAEVVYLWYSLCFVFSSVMWRAIGKGVVVMVVRRGAVRRVSAARAIREARQDDTTHLSRRACTAPPCGHSADTGRCPTTRSPGGLFCCDAGRAVSTA